MQKNNVQVEGATIIVFPDVCIMQSGDQLTIEIDKGGDAYTMLDELLAIQLQTIIGE